MAESNGLTRTHRALLEIFSDGKAHRPEELQAVLYDEYNKSREALRVHISSLRKHLRPKGEDILCQTFGRHIKYIHIRYLTSLQDEIYMQ